MGQMLFFDNFIGAVGQSVSAVSNSLSFFGVNITDSISLKTINLALRWAGAVNHTISMSLGLYSLTDLTLSLANSASLTISSNDAANIFLSFTNISTTQNITPGTWYFGMVLRAGGNSLISFNGQQTINPNNAFPGFFIGGAMTESTSQLPASYATSNLDITGNNAMCVPFILISA